MTYRRLQSAIVCAAALFAVACIELKDDDSAKKQQPSTTAARGQADSSSDISAPSYEAFALDTAGVGARFASDVAGDSAYGRISEKTAASRLSRFPARIPKRGAEALQIQVLLDRAHFSPGIIDGVWGDNAMRALAYFRNPTGGDRAAGPPETDTSMTIDQGTYSRLRTAAGSPEILTRYTVTAEDVAGPFTNVPDNVYEQAKLDCLCYSSAAEGIAEKFHTSQKLIAQLNPKATLGNLKAGDVLVVPNVDVQSTPASTSSTATASAGDSTSVGGVARLIISKKGYWTHAVDASGKILYHFPSTLGAGYDPSPTGDFRVTNVAWNPAFHYQPTLFAEVSDKKPEAHLPKGPNSPVGVIWMALSKPHYGIHGTSAPETIGYANSHGCVRLTNWDATELGRLVSKGTPVEFR
jgi:lipoprotein-anchoring transpeptidase ErfK/SrfK